MNHLSLCSGIGGLDLAAEWAGFRTVAQCEIDEYASRVLAKNFNGVPNLHDIRTVTNGRLRELGIRPEDITVISAGFPCQPYSLAGKGRGDRDERDLWGEVKRVLGDLRPRWFVGENTPGLFARENHRYFRRVLDDLAALGYSVAWGIWGACDVGAPHKRERVFLVAHADGERRGILRADERTTCGALGESEAETPFGAGGLYGTARGAIRETFITPCASDGKRTNLTNNMLAAHGIKKGGRTNLAEQIAFAETFPTPCASEAWTGELKSTQQKRGSRHSVTLSNYIALYPTPVASGKLSGGTGAHERLKELKTAGQISEEERRSVSAGNGGKLNPTWVEWLMGFPLGWTSLEGSGTR